MHLSSAIAGNDIPTCMRWLTLRALKRVISSNFSVMVAERRCVDSAAARAEEPAAKAEAELQKVNDGFHTWPSVGKTVGQIVDVPALKVMEEIDEVVRQIPHISAWLQKPWRTRNNRSRTGEVDVGATREWASERILEQIQNEEQVSGMCQESMMSTVRPTKVPGSGTRGLQQPGTRGCHSGEM